MIFLPPYIQFLLFFHFNELKMLSNDLDECLPSLPECMLSHVQLFATPWTLQLTKLLCPWNFPDKDTGVGCHFLLQGDLLNPGIDLLLCLQHWQADSSPLCHLGNPLLCYNSFKKEIILNFFFFHSLQDWTPCS